MLRAGSRLLIVAALGGLVPGAFAPARALARPAARAAAATVDRSHIPDGGPPPRLVLPRPARFRLSSGPQVVVVERHGLPMASVAVVWPRGAGDEPADRAGLAVLAASLLDEGTKKHGALALAEALDGLGAQLASSCTWDLTGVSLLTLTRQLDPALALLAEVVAEPAFDRKEFERLRGEQLTSLLQRRDAAAMVAMDVFSQVLYGAARRYGEPAQGTEATVKGITRDDVVAWYRRQLRPELATIIVAGDVSPKQVRASLERAFAGWKAEGDGASPAADASPLPPARRVIVDKPGAPQSEVRLGLPSVPRRSPDYFPLLVMNEILGGGEFSNRLNLNLREAHAYTYGAHSAIAFRREGGPFVVASATKTAVTAAAVMEAFSELLRIRSAPVDPRELRLAKDGLERAMARRFATLSEVTGELAAQVVYGLPDDFFSTFADKVEKVSAADVRRAAEQHLDPARLSIVVVGDRQAVATQLTGQPLGVFEELDAGGRPAVVRAATPAPPRAPAAPPSSVPATRTAAPRK